MFSMLEHELSRGLLRAARTKVRLPSPCTSRRAHKASLSRSRSDGSRPISNKGGKGSRVDGAAGSSGLQQDKVKTRAVTSTRVAEAPLSARQTVSHRYTSLESSKDTPTPGKKKPPLPPPDLGRDVQAFMQARPFEDIPGPTSLHHSIPFAGTRLLYYPFSSYTTDNMSNLLNKLQAKYGPIMRVKFGNEWVVIIDNLPDIESVVRTAEKETTGRNLSYAPDNSGLFGRLKKRVEDSALSWFGWNQVSREPSLPKDSSDGVPCWLQGGPQTQKLRADIAVHLNNKMNVGLYLTKQEPLAQDLIKNLDQLQYSAREVQTLLYRYSIESVVQMCFNKRLGLLGENFSTDGEKQKLVESYRTMVRCLGETMTGTRVLHMLFEDPFAKRFIESKTVVSDFERSMMREATVREIKEKGGKEAKKVPSLGEQSLLLSLLNDANLPEEQIFESMHALLTIGCDSVASTLQMLLYSLATNLEKQDKLAEEIQQILGPDGQLNPTALQSMKYLKSTVKESLRLNFPMAAGGRVVLSNNIVLDNYLVPAGTAVVVNSRRTAKNSTWFDHPHSFRPERWLEEEAKTIPSLAFMPFGFGANHCPSRDFSLQEINVAIVKILQKFKVDLPNEYQGKPLDTVYTLFLSPKEPLPFMFSPRSSQTQQQKKKK